MSNQDIGSIVSVQVGVPTELSKINTVDGSLSPWVSSFVRQPVAHPLWLHTTHLEGNRQADTQNHGRPNQAVLLYANVHYPLWQAELGRPEIGPGGFGENITVDALTEGTACIGDVYALGDARIQVTGPRYPCSKIEWRWQQAGLTARVAATGRTGWYCRVLCEGALRSGLLMQLIERPYPEFSVAVVNDFGHGRRLDIGQALALTHCDTLDMFWRELIERHLRHARQEERSMA